MTQGKRQNAHVCALCEEVLETDFNNLKEMISIEAT